MRVVFIRTIEAIDQSHSKRANSYSCYFTVTVFKVSETLVKSLKRDLSSVYDAIFRLLNASGRLGRFMPWR